MTTGFQPSLSAGEMAPGLHGRVDLARYAIGLKTCRNMVVRQTGGASKRPGTIFRAEVKDSAQPGRILPFVFSTERRYLIEAGNLYFRFHYLDDNNVLFPLEVGGNPVEVVTPYTTADLANLRITQSADVLFIGGVNGATKISPKELRRTSATTFTLTDHENRLGPFRALNADQAAIVAVSGVQGTVTVTSNVGLFTAPMIGSYVYVEEKELRDVRPWEPIERNPPLGVDRRSDGKVYRAVSIPSLSGLGGTPYYITGNTRPIHSQGRAFDGPGDTRSDGVNEYKVGVEWEYLHSTYGIVKITGFNSANSVTGEVVRRIPDSVIGTAPIPVAGPWTFSGDAATKQFTITGATSESEANYTVTIDGEPIQSDPYSDPDPGTGGNGGGLSDNRPGYWLEK